jgi:uncharacterized repeat protein (TIGR01451 family)
MRRATLTARLAAIWLFLASGLVGCAQHRIPAIDPTGQHIFSGTTTLASHDFLHGGLFHKRHDPAVAAAPGPVKPPCDPPVVAVPLVPIQPLVAVPLVPAPPRVPVIPVGCGPQQMLPQAPLPGKPQPGGPICETGQQADVGPELRITPARIVAPVNTEVILAAGICDKSGYFVTRQPLEWMLAQDGAGQIVAVGHESPGDVSFLLRNSPQKVATNYARAHTSTISQVLSRGTPSPVDDVYLHKGQAWITVTSPTEGTSHIVVWAPKEQNWDRRRTSATIYWVDAAWKFPPAMASRAGAKQTLTTVLTRANGEPITGWIVKYEALEGPPATFSARGNRAVEVITDRSGRATAELLPGSLEPGITPVRVQIIRPAVSRGDLPQMIVGQGTTTVQWTTPGLSVRAVGSNNVTADGVIAYRVEVTNTGDLITRGVSLSYTPPTGVSLLNSTPAAQNFGQRHEWRLGDLAPRSTKFVEVNCRASVSASVRSCFKAVSADQLTAEGCANTDVRTNALSVKMTGPDAVEVGREAKFLIEVTNIGSTPLTNVTASDTFDPGLSHTQGERSPLIRTLPPLAPNQTAKLAVSFNVTQPGRLCHRLDVTADGGHAAAARGCVTGIQPAQSPPQLSVHISGPTTRRKDDSAEYLVEIKNSGSLPASNVVLAVTWGINLQFQLATEGHEDDLAARTTRWRISQLPGGQSLSRKLVLKCFNADEQGSIVRATVTSQQTPALQDQIVTVITPPPAAATTPPPAAATTPMPRPDPAPIAPEPPAAGELKVSAVSLKNPIRVGETATWEISVLNDRAVSDRDVVVRVQVGDGLTIIRSTGPVPVPRSSTSSVEFDPVREARSSEPLSYRIEVRGDKPGPQKIQITVTSSRSPAGVSVEKETTVNP